MHNNVVIRNMNVWIHILLLLGMTSGLSAQTLTEDQRNFLNKEIRFLNESVHRMVIVFQVYENYNSEITKHVDLPTNEGIKNTSTHLPENLFADNNLVRRGDSPLELYAELSADPMRNNMPVNNWSLIEEAKSVIDFLNKDRKIMDNIIDNEDLEKFSNIQLIYGEIEKAVEYYDKLRSTIKIFEKLHLNTYHAQVIDLDKKQVYTAILELHYDVKKLVRQLRADSRSGVSNSVSKLEKEIGWLKACISKLESPQQKSDMKSAVVSIEKLIEEINNYLDGKPVPSGYEPFGRGYYFHNYELLPKINQYGSGYAWKLEEFFKKYDWPVLNVLEEPHYLKVVYPERIPIEMMTGDSIDPDENIRQLIEEQLPQLDKIVVEKVEVPTRPIEEQPIEEVKKHVPPPINIIAKETIKVDSAFFVINLFDHLRKDGDRVSINVNGQWVHERISLEKKTRKIELSINSGSANYIIIRADNVGWSTPNTIGLSYKANQSENNVSIRKDLQLNEAIEIRFIQ